MLVILTCKYYKGAYINNQQSAFTAAFQGTSSLGLSLFFSSFLLPSGVSPLSLLPLLLPLPLVSPPVAAPRPRSPPARPRVRVECTVLLLGLVSVWYCLSLGNAALCQCPRFGSVPVSQWLCLVGSLRLSFVVVVSVSVLVQLPQFVGWFLTFVPMVMSCFFLHFASHSGVQLLQFITSMLVSGVGVTLIIILLFSSFFFSIFVSFLICSLCYSVLCLFPHMFLFCNVLLPFFLLVVESDLVFFSFLFSVL